MQRQLFALVEPLITEMVQLCMNPVLVNYKCSQLIRKDFNVIYVVYHIDRR